jgi:hypothetical protein
VTGKACTEDEPWSFRFEQNRHADPKKQTTASSPLADPSEIQRFCGEPDRIRTCDPLIKSQLLYQLSYRPHEAAD